MALNAITSENGANLFIVDLLPGEASSEAKGFEKIRTAGLVSRAMRACVLFALFLVGCRNRSEGVPAPAPAPSKLAMPFASAVEPVPSVVSELFPGKGWYCFLHAAPQIASDSECFRKEADCRARRAAVAKATPDTKDPPSACSKAEQAVCMTIHSKATGGIVHCTAWSSSCRAMIERAKQANADTTASDCIENP